MLKAATLAVLLLLSARPGAAAEAYRVAYANSAGVEVFAPTGAAAWCGPEVVLELRLMPGSRLLDSGWADFIPKVGAVLDKECPAAAKAVITPTQAGKQIGPVLRTGRAQSWQVPPELARVQIVQPTPAAKPAVKGPRWIASVPAGWRSTADDGQDVLIWTAPDNTNQCKLWVGQAEMQKAGLGQTFWNLSKSYREAITGSGFKILAQNPINEAKFVNGLYALYQGRKDGAETWFLVLASPARDQVRSYLFACDRQEHFAAQWKAVKPSVAATFELDKGGRR